MISFGPALLVEYPENSNRPNICTENRRTPLEEERSVSWGSPEPARSRGATTSHSRSRSSEKSTRVMISMARAERAAARDASKALDGAHLADAPPDEEPAEAIVPCVCVCVWGIPRKSRT